MLLPIHIVSRYHLPIRCYQFLHPSLEQRSAAITKLLSKNGTELGYLHTQMSGYPLLDDAVICDALPDVFQFIVEAG